MRATSSPTPATTSSTSASVPSARRTAKRRAPAPSPGTCELRERERPTRETNREAAYARQQSMLAKEQRFIDRFAAHAAQAAQEQTRRHHPGATRQKQSGQPR